MAQHRIRIDLAKVLDVPLRSVRRAYAFLGFGLNASRREDVRDVHLNRRFSARLLPVELTDAQLKEIKETFGDWIVDCALREAIEGFAVFLDQLYRIALIIEMAKGGLDQATAAKRKNKFEETGITAKLAQLRGDYQISSKNEQCFFGLTKARNCLSHGRGIVEKRHCTEPGKLTIEWRGMELGIETHDGRYVIIDETAPPEGVPVDAGEKIVVKWVARRKEFAIGELIRFIDLELTDVLTMFVTDATDLNSQIQQWLAGKGIPLDAPSSTNPAG